MEDFMNPAYFEAVGSAVMYGLQVFVAMCVVGAGFVFASGGSAAKDWEQQPSH